MLLPIEIQFGESKLHEFADRMRLTGRHDIVVRLILLQHEPHCFDIIAGEAPIALGIEVAQEELLLQPFLDASGGTRDLAGHERLAAPRTLVIEQDAVADKEAVSLTIIDGVPVGGELADRVRAARIEWRLLVCGGGAAPNISDEPA